MLLNYVILFRWSEIEKSDTWPPSVCGHTLTYHKAQESLILIGGVSPQTGFLNMIWAYKLNKDKDHKEQWIPMNTRGPGPLGIFGHSTVYHSQSNNLFVFGGVVYERQLSTTSNNLYMFSYDNRTWTLLTSLESSIHWVS